MEKLMNNALVAYTQNLGALSNSMKFDQLKHVHFNHETLHGKVSL